MARYVTLPEALDDSFITIFVEDMLRGEVAHRHDAAGAPGDTACEDALLDEDDTAAGVDVLEMAATVGDEAWQSASQGQTAPEPASARPAEHPPATAGAGPWRLRVVEETAGVEHVVRLGAQPVTIGRSRENSVIVRCERVSRRHLRFWLDESGPCVENVSDHNRMRVNGRKVERANLKANDVIRIGLVRIHLERAGDHGPPTGEST